MGRLPWRAPATARSARGALASRRRRSIHWLILRTRPSVEGRVERGQQLCGPHRAGLGGQFGLEHGPGSGASGGVAPTTESPRMPGRRSSATFLPLRSRMTGSSVAVRMVSTAAVERLRRRARHLDDPRARGHRLLEGGLGAVDDDDGFHVDAGREQRREPLGQRLQVDLGPFGVGQVDVEVLPQRLVAGGERQPEVHLRAGRETFGARRPGARRGEAPAPSSERCRGGW